MNILTFFLFITLAFSNDSSWVLNRAGVAQRDSAHFTEALDLHFRALSAATDESDTLAIIDAYNNIATDLRRTSANAEASEYHFNALDLSQSSSKYIKNQAIAMNGLGNIFLALGNPTQAEEYLKKSLAIEIQLGSELGQAINYANLGEAARMLNQYEKAMTLYEQSLSCNKAIGSQVGVALCLNSMGALSMDTGNLERGLAMMRSAVDTLSASNDTYHQLEVMVSYCGALVRVGLLHESDSLLTYVIERAQEIGSVIHLRQGYELLSQLRQRQGNYAEALDAYKFYMHYSLQRLDENNEVRIREMENRNSIREMQQQLAIMTAEKKNQFNSFVALFLILVTIAVYYIYRNQSRKVLNTELQKINEMKTHFFTNVSHESRTPLTLVLGLLEKMKNSPLSTEQQEDVDTMLRNSHRLLRLVNQLLSLSKIEAGKYQLNKERGDLSGTLTGIALSFEHIALENKLHYLIDIKESGIVCFDSEIVETILINLLSNAMKFTSAGGHVSLLSAKPSADTYVFSVANTTPPKTPSQIDMMFRRFYSSHTSSSDKGTGIGLSLVKELCLLYGGNLVARYNERNEMEFTISLPIETIPLAEDNSKETDSSDYAARLPVKVENILFPLILIVEDNEDMRHFIAHCFKGSCNVIQARDGKEGIAMAKEHIPDLILSDVMMPNINGLELCDTIKTNFTTEHIPVVLLTAVCDQKFVLEGLHNQADDYITKPFNASVLKQKVLNLIAIRKKLSERYKETIDADVNEAPNNVFADTLRQVVEKHLSNPNFDVDEFCEVTAMSRTQLHRKLKAITGLSAGAFIRMHRLKMAAEKLRTDNTSNISEIAYLCGFNDPSYFAKSFKEMFHCTPGDYRNTE